MADCQYVGVCRNTTFLLFPQDFGSLAPAPLYIKADLLSPSVNQTPQECNGSIKKPVKLVINVLRPLSSPT
jgi:hypothetical protein